MKPGYFVLAAAIVAALLSPSSAFAQDIVVSQAWSRATPKGAQVAGGYLTIEKRDSHPEAALGDQCGRRKG